jgi:hypothetical protein
MNKNGTITFYKFLLRSFTRLQGEKMLSEMVERSDYTGSVQKYLTLFRLFACSTNVPRNLSILS